MSPPNNLDAVVSKVRKLVELADSGTTEEARTAAWHACQMLKKHGVLNHISSGRTRADLRPTAVEIAKAGLDLLWRERPGLLSVRELLDIVEQKTPFPPDERLLLHDMVSGLFRKLRARGLLIGLVGGTGGYRAAPGIRRAKRAEWGFTPNTKNPWEGS